MISSIQRTYNYAPLGSELKRRADLVKSYWFDRVFRPVAHRDCLALSWLGDTEYELALEGRREAEAAEKRLRSKLGRSVGRTGSVTISQKAVTRARLDASLLARAKFKGARMASYSYSGYVFFKSCETPPLRLLLIDRDLEAVYRAAPLHHYLLFMRRIETSDHEVTTDPGHWAPEKPTFATDTALVDYLMERVFPEQCPKLPRVEQGKGGPDWPLLSAIGAAGLVVALGVAAWFAYAEAEGGDPTPAVARPAAASAAMDPPAAAPDDRLAELENGIEDLRAQFTGLSLDISLLTTGGASPADFTTTARALESLAERLADAPAAPTQAGGGLDRPPCLPVRSVEGRKVPEYLFTAVLSDAGIMALPRPRRPDGPDLAPFQARFSDLRQTLSAEVFRSRAAPMLSAQPDCRHYVLLVEEEMTSAAQYAAQRQAVEEHFYIFRLQ
jgi:hypothetical protein